jgi:hypothetical protein
MTFKTGSRDIGEVTETKVLSPREFRLSISQAIADAGVNIHKVGFADKDRIGQPGGLLIRIDEDGEISSAYIAQSTLDRRTPLPRVVPTERRVTIIVPVGLSLTSAQKTLIESRINAIGASVTFSRN